MARTKAENKLTDRQKRTILDLYGEGEQSIKDIAKRFGVRQQTVVDMAREAGIERNKFGFTVWLRGSRAS